MPAGKRRGDAGPTPDGSAGAGDGAGRDPAGA